jgi:hypothetical protein
MKSILKFATCILLMGLLPFTSCKKQPVADIRTPPPPPPPVNYLPFADAGLDQTLNLACFDSAILHGRAYDDDLTGISYLWTQVSGPNQSNIFNPASAKTAITGIINEGIYQFELQVKDNNGAVDADTMELKAFRIPAGQEFLFEYLLWHEGDINEVFAFTPSNPNLFCDFNRPIEVSIRLANSNVWINIPESSNSAGSYYYIRHQSSVLVESEPADYSLVGTTVSIRVKFL